MAAATKLEGGPGQRVIPRGDREVESIETSARIDPARCLTAGPGDEFRGAAWVAVVGKRDDVTDDGAKKLAQGYWLTGRDGGIERAHGPIPDDGTVMPPRESGTPVQNVTSMESYLQRAAAMNVRKGGDKCVVFYLVRAVVHE